MASTSRDFSVYLKVTDARTGASKNITIRGIQRIRLLRFIERAVRAGLDECEEAIRKIPRRHKQEAA